MRPFLVLRERGDEGIQLPLVQPSKAFSPQCFPPRAYGRLASRIYHQKRLPTARSVEAVGLIGLDDDRSELLPTRAKIQPTRSFQGHVQFNLIMPMHRRLESPEQEQGLVVPVMDISIEPATVREPRILLHRAPFRAIHM